MAILHRHTEGVLCRRGYHGRQDICAIERSRDSSGYCRRSRHECGRRIRRRDSSHREGISTRHRSHSRANAPYELLAKPSIKSLKELKGKTVSIGGPKDVTRIYLNRMLEPNGLKDSDIDLVYAGASSARLSALESGAVDAAILTAPFNFYGASAGLSIIGRTADYITDLPQNGTVVNRNWATGHMSTLTRFLAAFNKGVDWFRDDRNRDEAINILVTSGNLKPHEV